MLDFYMVDFNTVDFYMVDLYMVDFYMVDFNTVDFYMVDFNTVDFYMVDLKKRGLRINELYSQMFFFQMKTKSGYFGNG